MSTDNTLRVRRAVVSHLKSYAPLTALVASSSIYGEQPPANPAWPFIRYGSTTLPYEATCWSGSTHLVDIHVFANGPYTDAVLNAHAQVIEAMKGFVPDGAIEVEWANSIGPLRDSPPAEAAKYHMVAQFNVTLVGP